MPIERLWSLAQLPEGRHDQEPDVVVWCPFCGKQLCIVMTLEVVSSNDKSHYCRVSEAKEV